MGILQMKKSWISDSLREIRGIKMPDRDISDEKRL